MSSDWDFKLQIGVIGDGKVGKSTLFYNFMVRPKQFDELIDEYSPTQGLNFFSKDYERGQFKYVLKMFDVNSYNSFLYSRFLPSTDCLILMFDLNDRNSFNHLKSWACFVQGLGYRKPIILVGNKNDLKKTVLSSKVKRDAAKWGCRYFELNALDKFSVNKLIDEAIDVFQSSINSVFAKIANNAKFI